MTWGNTMLLAGGGTSWFLWVFTILAIWAPLWILVRELRKFLLVRDWISAQRRRYQTYICVEVSIREIRDQLPIAQELLLGGEVLSRSAARKMYDAKPGSGKRWEDKVMVTELLERLNRLAIGAKMGVIEVDTWQKMSWFYVTTLRRVLRNYIDVSETHRSGRYRSLCEIDEVFQRIANRDLVEELGGPSLSRDAIDLRGDRVTASG